MQLQGGCRVRNSFKPVYNPAPPRPLREKETPMHILQIRPICTAAALCACLAACASAPQYDDTANTQLTNLQKEVDSQIVRFISDARQNTAESLKDASYAQNIKWYNSVDTDTTSLELRMEAVIDPSTANLPTFFDNLRSQMSNIQTAHQAHTNLPAVFWTVVRNQLNVQFAALITYELSLKGTSSSSSPTTTSTATRATQSKANSAPTSH
jgi:hypothetical protein